MRTTGEANFLQSVNQKIIKQLKVKLFEFGSNSPSYSISYKSINPRIFSFSLDPEVKQRKLSSQRIRKKKKTS
jgi:hypothetical protein